MLVFVDHLEILPDRRGWLRGRSLRRLQDVHRDLVARLQELRDGGARSIHPDLLRPHQLVQMAERQVVQALAEELVQALASGVGAHLEVDLHRGWLSEKRETRQVPSCCRESVTWAPRCSEPPPWGRMSSS